MAKSKSSPMESVMVPKPSVSRVDLSHDHVTTFNLGECIPSVCIEALPGDVFTMSAENMARFAPMLAPPMHRINIDTHFYFVPNRILSEDWNDFITGNDEVEWNYMVLPVNQPTNGSLGHYLGINETGTADQQVSSLPVAAYLRIWNDYYRDQDLQPDLFEKDLRMPGGNNTAFQLTGLGSGELLDYALDRPLMRNWQKDYFTTARPWAQKGDEVMVPVVTSPVPVGLINPLSPTVAYLPGGGVASDGPLEILGGEVSDGVDGIALDSSSNYEVDVQSNAALMTDLWRAWALQRHLGMLSLTGTRINEWLLAVFGVRSSDARLQKPEYFGGLRQHVSLSEVVATATAVEGDGTPVVPQGNLAGHGISVGRGNRFTYRCEEHGWIIVIVSCMAKTSYGQGLHKQFFRRDRFDYYTPGFDNVGNQPIYVKELYNLAETAEEQDAIFGYTERWMEYKTMNNRVSGEMLTGYVYWNLARLFSNLPVLNASFVSTGGGVDDEDALNRIFAVTTPTVDHIYAFLNYDISVLRKMPLHALPSGV